VANGNKYMLNINFEKGAFFKLLFFLLIGLLGVQMHLHSQHPYRFRHISIKDGLSQSTVKCSILDSRGLMWFGTEDGLNRYDGYKFTIYTFRPGVADSLSSSYIYTLFVDSTGQLWVGTREGLNKFNPQSNNFTVFRKSIGSLSGHEVMAICEDSDGFLWLATSDGGLNRFDREKETFTVYRTAVDSIGSLPSNNLTTVFCDSSGVLWVGTRNSGFARFHPKTDTFTSYRHIAGEPGGLSHNEVLSITEGPEGDLWVGTRNGLNRFNDKTGSFTHFKTNPNDKTSISNNVINTLHETPSGVLLIGTENGLNRFNPVDKNFTVIRNNSEDSTSLSNNLIWSIYEDPYNVLWIGTDGGGINNYAPGRFKFSLFRYNPRNPNYSLMGKFVYTLHEDREDNIWVGTDLGLNKYRRETGKYTHYTHNPNDPQSLSNEYVFALFEDKQGNFWVGTWGGGLNKLDRKTGKFKHYLPDPNNLSSISHDVIRVIYEGREGGLWIGTEGGGINRFDRETERFIHYHGVNDNHTSLSNNYITSITEDARGLLWIGTNVGLNRFNRETQQFTRYLGNPEEPRSISNSSVASVFSSSDGVLWIGTFGGGLNQYDSVSDTFLSYTKKDGLPNDVIYGILEDNRGNLWLSTNNGLSMFNPESKTFRNYYERDGLQSNEFNQSAYFKCRNGQLMFGGLAGFNLFHPNEIRKNIHVPPIIITDFKVFNESIKAGPNSLLKKSIIETQKIKLSHRDYVFSFEFAALDYYYPPANKYAYMMEGIDKDWNLSGTRRFAAYTTLPSGNYVFKVKGSNNDAVWNEEPTSIRIIITPPIWQAWWFRIFAAAALVLLVLVVFRIRTHNIRKRNRLLEEINLKLNREVTDRKVAEENLKKSEHRIRSFLQTASEGFLEVDTDGCIIDVNPEMCDILGRQRENIIGSLIFEFVDAKGSETIRNELKLRRRGKRSSYELTMLQPDKTEIHCLINASPIYNDFKEVCGSFALITDITDIIQAEEELMRTRNYLQDVLDSLSSILISVDPSGLITQWNRAAENYIRSSAEKIYTGKVWEVLPFLKPYRPQLEKVINTRLPVELHKESVVIDRNEKKHLDIFMYPLMHSDLEGVVIRLDDVTEMENKDRQLIQAQKMEIVGNLAGGLAHDFNNVLGGIIGTISLLQFLLESEDALDVENIRNRVETIERGAERAVDLVKQLLTLSRKNEPLLAPADLNLALKHVLKICENTFDKSINIDVSFFDGRAMVWADATQIEQVLLNLCINAAHSMTIMREAHDPLGGTLSISISTLLPDKIFHTKHPEAKANSYWGLHVSDTGVGIDAKIIPNIFDPFFTTKSEQKGTGLGLAMVYHILQLHNGFIDVYSEPGEGTTFKVYLPRLEKQEGEIQQTKPEQRLIPGSGLILIVDDEEQLRSTSKEILNSCGYEVITAKDGLKGVELFKERHQDITAVLLDMAMPVMSGKDAFIEMKKIDPNLKVLLSSGFKQDKRVKAVLKLGVSGFLQKPFSMLELAKKMSEIVSDKNK
jgi:PAS domain S-box-containing protein